MEEENKIEPTTKDIARRRIFILGAILVVIMMVLILVSIFDIFTNTVGR